MEGSFYFARALGVGGRKKMKHRLYFLASLEWLALAENFQEIIWGLWCPRCGMVWDDPGHPGGRQTACPALERALPPHPPVRALLPVRATSTLLEERAAAEAALEREHMKSGGHYCRGM